MIKVGHFVEASGTAPFAKWRDTLDPATRARGAISIFRLESGNFSVAKGVGGGLFELRLDFGPGYRVYFGRDGDELVILLGGGSKKRQQRDIEEARGLWRAYKQTKGRGMNYVEHKTF